jgi:hypothetical protein
VSDENTISLLDARSGEVIRGQINSNGDIYITVGQAEVQLRKGAEPWLLGPGGRMLRKATDAETTAYLCRLLPRRLSRLATEIKATPENIRYLSDVVSQLERFVQRKESKHGSQQKKPGPRRGA